MSLKEEEELDFNRKVFGVQESKPAKMEQKAHVEFSFIKKIKETEKAILFAWNDEDGVKHLQWIPLSQIRKINTETDGTGVAEITQWIADKNNLSY